MIDVLHGGLYTLAFVALLTSGGNRVCQLLFKLAKLDRKAVVETRNEPPAGWIIGGLERSLLAVGLLTRTWEVLAAVIALKSVARFKDLDDRDFAEYFLVGSLFSILWSLLVTGLWLVYDRHVGVDLWTMVAGMMDAPKGAGR